MIDLDIGCLDKVGEMSRWMVVGGEMEDGKLVVWDVGVGELPCPFVRRPSREDILMGWESNYKCRFIRFNHSSPLRRRVPPVQAAIESGLAAASDVLASLSN